MMHEIVEVREDGSGFGFDDCSVGVVSGKLAYSLHRVPHGDYKKLDIAMTIAAKQIRAAVCTARPT